MNIPLLFCSLIVLAIFDHPFTAFVFWDYGYFKWTLQMFNDFINWAEIYGVKYMGSIKALTTALMVFSTAFGTAIFGILIDLGFSIENIASLSVQFYMEYQ